MKKLNLNLLAAIIVFLVPFSSIAQTTITVAIKSSIKIDSISMDDISTTEHYNLPYKDTLTFNFRKSDIDCYNIKYYINHKRYKEQLWLDDGKVTVSAHLTDTAKFVIDTVLNSPFYYHKRNFLKNVAALRKDSAAFNAAVMKELENYIEKTWSMYLAFDYINYNQNSKSNLLKLKTVLAKQKTNFSWFLMYPIAIAKLDRLLTNKSLKLANFTFVDRKGNTAAIKLSGYNYYLLDFWFLGCPPCRRDHMWISDNFAEIAAKRIKVISISTDGIDMLSEWNSYLDQHNYRWDNFIQNPDKKITEYLGFDDFPSYVLLDSKGDVIRLSNTVIDAISEVKSK